MDNNNDDWCYLDSETSSVRSNSLDDEIDEPECEPMYVEECVPKVTTVTVPAPSQPASIEDVDIMSLLEDSAVRSGYTRETRLAMLAPEHRRYVLTGRATAPKPMMRKRTLVREAFMTPSQRQHTEGATFAKRLRAEMPSRRLLKTSPQAVELTNVAPFMCDQGVQVNMDAATDKTEAPAHGERRLTQLSSVLDRSLQLSMQLKAKSHDVEHHDIRAMRLQAQLDDRDAQIQQLDKKLSNMERGIRISSQRSAIAEQYQCHLKRELDQQRAETLSLHDRITVLAGGLDLDAKSVDELEQLEELLDKATAKVRAALRAKYRAAVLSARETKSTSTSTSTTGMEDECVVCLEKMACVKLEPCGHEVLCAACAVHVTTCPMDRTWISNKVLTHGLDTYINQ